MLYVLLFFALYIFLIFKVVLYWLNDPARRKRDCIFVLFAPPGCGKTTALAMLVSKFRKKKYTVYANFECKDTIRIKWSDIGTYSFKDSVVLIDEAGIDLNNRKFMEMTAKQIEYLKTHRHYRCEMWFASQAHDDIDITVRRLAQRYYIVSRTFFNFITKKFCLRAISKRIGIDKNTHQVVDLYEFVLFSKWKFKGKKYWKYFDSFSQKPLSDYPVTVPAVPLEPQRKKKTKKVKKGKASVPSPEIQREAAEREVQVVSAPGVDLTSQEKVQSESLSLAVSDLQRSFAEASTLEAPVTEKTSHQVFHDFHNQTPFSELFKRF